MLIQNRQLQFDEETHKKIEDLITSWEKVVSPSKSDQIVRYLTSSKKNQKNSSVNKRENGSELKTPPIHHQKFQNINKYNIKYSSESKQNTINTCNSPQVYDLSFSSNNEVNGNRYKLCSQSSSSSSQIGSNLQWAKKEQKHIQQDISSISSKIKKYQDSFQSPQNNPTRIDDVNQIKSGNHIISLQKQHNHIMLQNQQEQFQINQNYDINNQDYQDGNKQFGIQTASFQPVDLYDQTRNGQQENFQIQEQKDNQISQQLQINQNIQQNEFKIDDYKNNFNGNQTGQFINTSQNAQNIQNTYGFQVNNMLNSNQSTQEMHSKENMLNQDPYNPQMAITIKKNVNQQNSLINQNHKNVLSAQNNQMKPRENRSLSSQYQFTNQSDQTEQIVQSWPSYLTKNIHSISSQQIQPLSSNEFINQSNINKNKTHQKQNGVYQSMKITEMSQNQHEQIQPLVEYQDNYKRITFSDLKQEFTIESEHQSRQESKYLSPQQILQRSNLIKFDSEINYSNCNFTPNKKSCMKKSNTSVDIQGRNISPTKSKEDQRLINLINNHEGWKKDIIKNWLADRDDKEYEKQKAECTFQPNLGKSKKYIEKISQNMNNIDVVQRLYDYSTPKKREMIQYQHLIDKECQELEKCTFQPNISSNSKQHQNVSKKVGMSPISPYKKLTKYQQNNTQNNSENISNQPIKGFDEAVQRMKKGFEKAKDQKAMREKIRAGTYYESKQNKLFNPPSMLLRNSSNSSSQPFYFANVSLNNGKQGKVSLSEDDDPVEVALNFSKVFKLNKEMTENLKIVLIESYKQHIVKLLSEQQN